MASVLAELLVKEGSAVTFVTPAAVAAAYSVNTMEQTLIQAPAPGDRDCDRRR